ncbi:hypothetical protein PsYK624_124300 [Phanerochaete sordida]|uniref:Uncharacterized protein n=1 Tax=Phanerochaete sordida TaxID=48140 RepID=A0A9P3LI68_9APHY|nr:hypothetical protein PsYK624_124300 [Phanerochaete sordida]
MSKTDTMVSLDPEDSAQILEMVEGLSLGPASPNAPGAVFGSARKRSLSKAKEASQRDSQTLPWKNPMRYSNARKDSVDVKKSSPPSPPARSESPDIDAILARTPRPRKTSLAGPLSPPRVRSTPSSRTSPQSAHKHLADQSLSSIRSAIFEDESDDGEGGSESDSSLDIHTPLPHLMFRDGLLSPRSKLLPQSTSARSIYSSFGDNDASRSVMSLASTAGSVTTKSGLQRDPRDTERRRVRHRDGRLLKAGMGLTTGLGWSDSEDEDAPSTLTRRLIASTIERQNASPGPSSRPSSMYDSTTSRLTSPVPSTSSRIFPSKSSHSSLRSASVSFPARAPSAASSSATGLRIPRGRAASTASVRSKASRSPQLSPPPLASSPELEESLGSIAEATLIRAGFASSIADDLESMNGSSLSLLSRSTGRSRAESSASTASMVTTTSYSSVPPPLPPKSAPAISPMPSFSNMAAPPLRARTESTGSNVTNETAISTGSSYSQNSSSTSVPSSCSSGSVPRPLRLPQVHAAGASAAGLHPSGIRASASSRSFSQDPSSGGAPALQRPRTFSNPQSAAAQASARTTSNSLSSGVLPPGAPPTLRQRPTPPGGARPRPRTGTGMVYRTSSYSSSYTSFHEGGARMRGASVASP